MLLKQYLSGAHTDATKDTRLTSTDEYTHTTSHASGQQMTEFAYKGVVFLESALMCVTHSCALPDAKMHIGAAHSYTHTLQQPPQACLTQGLCCLGNSPPLPLLVVSAFALQQEGCGFDPQPVLSEPALSVSGGVSSGGSQVSVSSGGP